MSVSVVAPSAVTLDTKSIKKPCRRLLTLKAAADYLSYSPWTLRNLIRRGQLPIVQFEENGSWRIDISDLDELISRYKRTA